ncbi:MAG: XRE family transcriptional regulator [Cytophagia bacterium]|nr:MAG: XRE family transcriptional regulator [Cytophagales bacterium]TAG03063.1 MAG: XRE family transcriptional regulator [Cytophagia bacterium]TAG42261.1 MAG: XRE family transcriptional regulator [Cytophagia bacterium]
MINIGTKIKKVRELRNFTQDYVAEKLEMTQAGYSKIEQGIVDVPYSRLEQIAKVLNIKIEDIISFDEKVLITNQLNNHANITNGYILGDKLVLEYVEKNYLSRIDDLTKQVDFQQKEIERLHIYLKEALSK